MSQIIAPSIIRRSAEVTRFVERPHGPHCRCRCATFSLPPTASTSIPPPHLLKDHKGSSTPQRNMNSHKHAALGHQFGDLQCYDTDVPALTNNSVRGPLPEITQSHLSPNMDSIQRYLYTEKQGQDSRSPVHLDLPCRSVSRSPHVRGGAYPVHRPQSPSSGTSLSYSNSLFATAPETGLDNYPALYRPSNPRAQSEARVYCRDMPRDTSSHLPLPRQRRNTYVSQLDLFRRDLYSSTDTSTCPVVQSGYTPERRSAMPPPMARSQSPSSSLIEHQEDCGRFVHQEVCRELLMVIIYGGTNEYM